ncbi:MAG: YciI family protein [Gammaproteobacteria bacterium]
MWYAIFARDNPDSLPLRKAARPAHLERMRRLRDEGRVLTAGPLPAIDAADPGPAGFAGSILVLEFEDLEAARAWMAADPYVEAGVYEGFEVFPYLPVMP